MERPRFGISFGKKIGEMGRVSLVNYEGVINIDIYDNAASLFGEECAAVGRRDTTSFLSLSSHFCFVLSQCTNKAIRKLAETGSGQVDISYPTYIIQEVHFRTVTVNFLRHEIVPYKPTSVNIKNQHPFLYVRVYVTAPVILGAPTFDGTSRNDRLS